MTKHDRTWDRYRDNFSRHLLGVARFVQGGMMNTLETECGHHGLRLGFAAYIVLIGERTLRPTELAESLGISRQACNQVIRQLETAGYVGHVPDPADGRARHLVLTAQGSKLRRDGIRIATRMDRQLAAIAGREAIADAARTLGRISAALGLARGAQGARSQLLTGMAAMLPRLADYTLQRLMELTRARGHPDLKISFGQVLTLIGPAGGRIQQIAAIQDVSKQAVSAIATELEGLGYLYREEDPADARQLVLRFTERGAQLLADSVASVEELAAELADIAGKGAMKRLQQVLHALYHGLQLERDVFGGQGRGDLPALAEQLKEKLGLQGSRELARLLLQPA